MGNYHLNDFSALVQSQPRILSMGALRLHEILTQRNYPAPRLTGCVIFPCQLGELALLSTTALAARTALVLVGYRNIGIIHPRKILRDDGFQVGYRLERD